MTVAVDVHAEKGVLEDEGVAGDCGRTRSAMGLAVMAVFEREKRPPVALCP